MRCRFRYRRRTVSVSGIAVLLIGASVVINVDSKPGVSQARAGGVGEELKTVVEALADVSVILDYAPMSSCGSKSKCLAEVREVSQTDDVILVMLEPAGEDVLLVAERSKKRRAKLITQRAVLSGGTADHSMQLAQLVGGLFGLRDLPPPVAATPPPPKAQPPPPKAQPPPPPPAATAPPPVVATTAPDDGGGTSAGAWVLFSGGLALAGAGVGLFVVAEGNLSDLEAKLDDVDEDTKKIVGIDFDQATSDRDGIDLQRTLAVVSGGVGAAALIGSIIWLALPSDSDPSGAIAGLGVQISPDGGYASWATRW